MFFESVGVLAAIAELFAIYLIGKKNKNGFLFGLIGNILWITYSLLTYSAFGLIFISTIAFTLNIKGFRLWKQKKEH